MGTRSFINATSRQRGVPLAGHKPGGEDGQPAFVHQPGRSEKPLRLRFDVTLLLVTLSLVIFGVLMVYSASADFSYRNYGDATLVFERQLRWLGLGSVGFVIAMWFDYHRWRTLPALGLMILAIVGLVAVLFVQDERFGAVRSLLSGSVQPSELAKLAIVIYLSVWLYNRRDQIHYWTFGIIPLSVIMGSLGSLIYAQPDYSALVTIILLGGMLFFLAGGDLRQLLIVALFSALFSALVLRSGFIPTGEARISSFWSGIQDPFQYSDHVRASLEAFIRGGWFGVGIGKSETKLLGLPFPHTDSIFAVVGEETGVLGAATLVILYALLMWRSLVIARRAPDALGSLMAAGLGFWLMAEACINMAVMVGLLPFAGNALPFITAGGSSLIVSMVAVGVILNVSRQAIENKEQEERSFNALVNLRRWDRRRRVSRPRGSTSRKSKD